MSKEMMLGRLIVAIYLLSTQGNKIRIKKGSKEA